MKNKIRKIIEGDWLLFTEALLCFIFGVSLVIYPEYISSKTILIIGIIFMLEGAKVFRRWLNDEYVKEIKVVEPILVKKERPKKEKEFDGGDDFRTFKAENGIID